MHRELKIRPVLNGWIVECGCQTVVFTNPTIMAEEIKAYYADPKGVEKRYFQNRVNDTLNPEGPQPVDPIRRGPLLSATEVPYNPPTTMAEVAASNPQQDH